MNIKKVGFTGTHHGMTAYQLRQLCLLLCEWDPNEFHHGDCVGADAVAHAVASKLRIEVIVHPPVNTKGRAFCQSDICLPPKPYIKRNHDIVDATDVLIAAPHQPDEVLRSGTWATVRYARQHGKEVYLLLPIPK